MKAIDLKSLIIGVCIGAAALFAVGAVPQEHKAVEYKVVNGDIWNGEFQKKLNDIAPEVGSYRPRAILPNGTGLRS